MFLVRTIVPRLIFAFTLAVIVWCIIANIYQLSSWVTFLILAALVLLGVFINKTLLWRILQSFRRVSFRSYAVILISFVVLSIAGRFFASQLAYQPFSDPATFFSSAQSLAETGKLLEPGYVADFPYTYPYTVLLSWGIKLFGANHLPVIILNLLFDLISAFLIFVLVKSLSKKTNRPWLPFFAGVIWLINPFTFAFSLLSLPVSLFNMLLILSIYMVKWVLHYLDSKSLALLGVSALTGIVFGVANSVRPLAAVFIIAISIIYLLYLLGHAKIFTGIKLATSLVAIFFFYSLINIFFSNAVESATHKPTPGNASGWSIFVGTNLKTAGQWSAEDLAIRRKVTTTTATPQETHDAMLHKAIDRFSAYTSSEKLELVTKKTFVLGGQQSQSIYNLNSYPAIKNRPWLFKLMTYACAIFTWLTLILSAVFLYSLYTSKFILASSYGSTVLFLALAFSGLFAAQLLTEVSSRYFAPFFVFVVMFAVLGIEKVKQSRVTQSPMVS